MDATMSNSSFCRGDAAFGPIIEGCRDDLDFTLLFENTILSILPSTLVLGLAAIRIWTLNSKPRILDGRNYQNVKIAALLAYGGVQIALLISWSLDSVGSAAAIAAATLAFVNVILFCSLSYLEHCRALRPSALLILYMLITILFDAAKLRTLWLQSPRLVVTKFQTVSVALKAFILVLESREKAKYLPSIYRLHHSPEHTSSILNQSVYYWLNSLLVRGASKVLVPTDLYHLDSPLAAANLSQAFFSNWITTQKSDRRTHLALWKSLKWSFLTPVIPRTVVLVLTMCQPLLLQKLLNYLQTRHDSERYTNIGNALIGAYVLVYLGLSMSDALYRYWHRRFLAKLRGVLVSAVSWHTSKVQISVVKDPKSVVTLMSTDVERTVEGIDQIHNLWAGVIQIVVAVTLLERQLGLACIAPVAVGVVSTILTVFVSRTVGKAQGIWVEAIEGRVSVTSDMIGSMRGVKMTGLESIVFSLVQKLRIHEIKKASGFRRALVGSATLAFAPEFLTPCITFAIFVFQNRSSARGLDVSTLFTALSLIMLLAQPLNMTTQNLPSLVGAFGCIRRIHIFLSTDEQIDKREHDLPASESGAIPSLSDGDIEMTTLNQQVVHSNKGLHQDPTQLQSPHLFEIRNTSIRWGNQPDTLKRINITIPTSGLTVLIGPVASGKSTFLESLLGQTTISAGQLKMHATSKEVAYCAQSPYLVNGTIRDNIVASSNYVSAWYERVISAAELSADIAQRQEGDLAMVGSRGESLSGGQKQKVAIARAVYARKKIALFDDSFSGLDPASERAIVTNIFAPSGLLRTQNTSIIFATSSLRYISLADHIIALSGNGDVLFEGSYNQLRSVPGYTHITSLQNEDSAEDTDVGEQIVKSKLAVTSVAPEIEEDIKALQTRQIGEFATYAYYFSSAGIVSVFLLLLAGMVGAIFYVLPTAWLRIWAEASQRPGYRGDPYYLGLYSVYQCLSLICLAAVVYLSLLKIAVRSGLKLHQSMLTTVINAPLAFFTFTETGTIVNRFSQDIQMVDGDLPFNLLNIIFTGFTAAGQSILIIVSSPYVGIAMPILLFILYFVQKFYLKTSRQLRLLDLEAKSPLYTHFLETLAGLSTIRAFGWTNQNLKKNTELLDKSQKPFYLLSMVQQWLALVLSLVVACIAILIVTLAVKLESNSGAIGVALSQVINLGTWLSAVIVNYTALETSLGAISRIKTFCEDTDSEHKPIENVEVPKQWPDKGRIDWKTVVAAYDSKPDNPALQSLTLSIRPGEKIGLCGSSGRCRWVERQLCDHLYRPHRRILTNSISGKTSLILSLFRLIDYQDGSITIDDVELNTIPRQTIRAQLNVVPQDAFLLHGTVRFNLDMHQRLSDEELIRILERVRLWESAVQPHGGLGVDIADCKLSHGQRQLFCLARALARPGKIVVLDEFTSSVDHETDAHMQRIIREEFKDRTIIAIAHRLDTILDFDRIAVLDHGRLVEYDSPDRLLSYDSRFKALYKGEKH